MNPVVVTGVLGNLGFALGATREEVMEDVSKIHRDRWRGERMNSDLLLLEKG